MEELFTFDNDDFWLSISLLASKQTDDITLQDVLKSKHQANKYMETSIEGKKIMSMQTLLLFMCLLPSVIRSLCGITIHFSILASKDHLVE